MNTASHFYTHRRALGNRGETQVADWLKADGYTIVARNFRRRAGEIDVIARKGEVLSFVEVKMRTHVVFHLSEVITPRKRHKIATVAKEFVRTYPHDQELVYRFDVALVEQCTGAAAKVTYIPNAFVPNDL